ncbi:putative T6SS immunity periplasmic lipoprotein [Serratia ficaria]|uniref:putative T6SS immunity periplasmic lipoprotein n=1 Tax=Serratia ficaria TaxID=61651 RepID=UPI0021B79BE0|nr:putative T6SS immunity periplasmic lipoprotein [Serratia ficaria]
MRILTFLLTLSLLTGCVQERPWHYQADASVKNNHVCISVPDDVSGIRKLVGISIYRPGKGGKAEWSASVEPGQPVMIVMPGSCLADEFKGFVAGSSYSVEISTIGEAYDDTPRKYWTEFRLVNDMNDKQKIVMEPVQR